MHFHVDGRICGARKDRRSLPAPERSEDRGIYRGEIRVKSLSSECHMQPLTVALGCAMKPNLQTAPTSTSPTPEVSAQPARDRFVARDQNIVAETRPAPGDFETVIEFDPDDWSESSMG